jgi:hypothetical protein
MQWHKTVLHKTNIVQLLFKAAVYALLMRCHQPDCRLPSSHI